MGIIIKESFNQTAIRIAISVIGAVATIFIYPMDRNLYGIIGNVINTSVLFMPFIVLGLGQASIRFFPYTSSTLEKRKHFLYFLFKILGCNIILFSILFFSFKEQIIAWSKNPSEEYITYFIYTFPGALLFAIVAFLVSYISNYKMVAIPIGLQSAYRIVVPVSFLLIYIGYINIGVGIWMIYGALILAMLLLLWIIYSQIGQEKVISDKGDATYERKDFFRFYFWAFASSLGAMFAFKIDAFMVPWLTDFTLGGDYMIAMVIIGVIVIPTTSVSSIAHPIISQAWKDNKVEDIKVVYRKGSRNLLAIGAGMLIGILLLLDVLPLLLNDWRELKHIKLIVLVLGIGKVFDMASSVNGVIIAHSKWFRYNTWFVLVLVFSNVILNFFFILKWDILGAAVATALSLILFNLLKTGLLYQKIKFHPFDRATILFFFVLSAILYINMTASNFIGDWSALAFNIILGALFMYATLFTFKFAPDTNKTIFNLINKIK